MATRDIYTADQLERIRNTLKNTLGEASDQALENLSQRFKPAQEDAGEEAKLAQMREKSEKNVNVDEIVASGTLSRMMDAMTLFQGEPEKQLIVVPAILAHKDIKSSHMVDALSKVGDNVQMVEMLVEGVTALKGVNPLIEALRYATPSSNAVLALAKTIAEQGTVNHLIRTIAGAPRNQPEAEIVWAMEVMRKGSLEQMLEAINLMDDKSPGVVILATGVVNRRDVGIEPIVRALTNSKGNAKACGILAVELSQLADINALITLLEKYVSDTTEAGEILTAKLVHRCLNAKSRDKLLGKACRHMHDDSSAGRILAMGIYEQGDAEQLERAFFRMEKHPSGQKIIMLGISKKLNVIKIVRLIGKEYFQLSKQIPAIEASLKETKKRYHWVVQNILGEEIVTAEEAKKASAKNKLAKELEKAPSA